MPLPKEPGHWSRRAVIEQQGPGTIPRKAGDGHLEPRIALWKGGKPPSYPAYWELSVSSCNHGLGGKSPSPPEHHSRKHLTAMVTPCITMVMNGIREGSQWSDWGKTSNHKVLLEEDMGALMDKLEAEEAMMANVVGEHMDGAQDLSILPETVCVPLHLPLPGLPGGSARKVRMVHDTHHQLTLSSP